MGEEGGTDILLSSGISYPLREMDKFRALVEKHAALLNSVDPDNRKRGFEMVNDEGRECGWHVQDDASRVDDELSTLWKQLTEYARSINLELLDDEEDDDGGMEHKLYGQMVEYFKSGKIPYENYKNREDAKKNWRKKCSFYTLADDGLSLKKGTAYVLKRGEVMDSLCKIHRILGHSRHNESTYVFISTLLAVPLMKQKYKDIVTSCSCGYTGGAEVNFKDIRICVTNSMDGGRSIVFSSDTLIQEGPFVQKVKPLFSLCESEYQDEVVRCRSSNKDKLLPRFVFMSRKQALTTALVQKCNFCRCKVGIPNIVLSAPVDWQKIVLYIKVHYDEGAFERRFEISTSGVDPKVVDSYVKNTFDTLKEHGKWKEPVFSPSVALARSVVRVADLLRRSQKEEIDNVIEFDPIQNDTVSMQEASKKDLMEECDAQSEPESVVVSMVDREMSGEEEEKMIDEEEEESDVEDEELIQMRLQLDESERQAEDMENNASRLADSTGRMRVYIRQCELSDYLREQIRLSEVEGKESVKKVGEKRAMNRKKKRNEEMKKEALEKPPYDLTPYRANYEASSKDRDTVDTPSPFHPIPLNREDHPTRKRGRLAQLRREKEVLERNTKKEEEKKVLPLRNPYAAIFNGNTWPEEQMEKIRRMREERERRKEAGLTESEEDDEYEEE